MTLPTENDIKVCGMSEGCLCTLDKPLYPEESVKWCIYVLFHQNPKTTYRADM